MGNCLKNLLCNKKYKNNKIKNFCLLLKIIYGKKSKNGIYDYKGLDKDYEHNDFLYHNSFYIIFDLINYNYYFSKSIVKNKITNKLFYFHCEIKENTVKLDVNQNKDNFINDQSFWKVCYPYDSYTIEEGDVIKIGKIKLNFKSINIINNDIDNENKDSIEFSMENINDNSLINSEFNFNNNLHCRICLEQEVFNNRYIKTCKCYYNIPIHTNCFFKWMDNHVNNIKNEDFYYYEYKNLKCEICLERFPYHFKKKNGEIKSIFNWNKFKINYAIIEIYETDSLEIKGVYILFLKDNLIKIGKSESNNFILQNKTISQNHAVLDIFKNEIKLKDLNSRFGTHIYIKNVIEINKLSYLNLQFDKYMIDFTFIKDITEKEINDCINLVNLKINYYDEKNEFLENDSNNQNDEYIKYSNIKNRQQNQDEILITNLITENKPTNEKEVDNEILNNIRMHKRSKSLTDILKNTSKNIQDNEENNLETERLDSSLN